MANPATPDQQGLGMSLTFVPPPHELSYYDALFNVADQRKTGSLGGAEAVQFMSRSNIPTPTLKNIWNMADQNPKTNSLDRRKFHIAVRLIQLFQNGQRPQGATLAVADEANLKPANFSGITGTLVPSPALPNPGATPPQQQFTPQPPSPKQMQLPMMSPQGNKPDDSVRNHVTTLTSHQDQYVMFPHEQTRYEALFPNYEKLKDGYVYGAEAVALFSKSGLSKDQLREIWNLADNPVDNRLDKLEFAIAMHLIVCISKKNLELPKVLPASLQALKTSGLNQPSVMPTTQTGPSSVNVPAPNSIPSPAAPNQNIAPSMQLDANAGMNPPQLMQPTQEVPASNEPTKPTTMSISDAFNDIPIVQPGSDKPPEITTDPSSNMKELAQTPQVTTEVNTTITLPSPTSLQPAQQMQANTVTVEPVVEGVAPSNQNPIKQPTIEVPAPNAVNPSSTAYEYTEEKVTEVQKLKKLLQQMQAENISLKAELASVAEEESDVKDEIGTVVVEIEELSKDLLSLRNEVAEAKSALNEAAAELKEQTNKKNNITDSINETKETLGDLKNAVESIETAKKVYEQKVEEQKPVPVNDFFGGFEDVAPTQPPNPPVNLDGNGFTNQEFPASGTASSSTSDIQQAPLAQNNPENGNAAPAPYTGFQNTQPFMNEDPNAVYTQQVQNGTSSTQPNQPGPPTTAQMQNMQHGQYNSVQMQQMRAGAPMGGMTSPDMANPTIDPNSFSHVSSRQDPPPPTQEEVNKMKMEALAAADAATKAEQEQQFAYLRAEELQQAADEAESHVLELQQAMEKKKSKGFKRSGKKTQKKEYEQALQKVVEMKKEASEAQGRITALQANAMKAKREADELRQKSEQAEFDVAKAASVQEMQTASHTNGNVGQISGNAPAAVYQNNGYSMGMVGAPMNGGMPNGIPADTAQGFDNPFQTFGY